MSTEAGVFGVGNRFVAPSSHVGGFVVPRVESRSSDDLISTGVIFFQSKMFLKNAYECLCARSFSWQARVCAGQGILGKQYYAYNSSLPRQRL
ncbi:hypothetical protein PflSS101_1460 [Pseudomonas lactis]|uniref:Uncharacterized protein n=1 Tax=Pseudomonas lactis TaxID=1615674 RepID=I4KCN4_9PSED|nr:hypothetical protein PflSS101_1460 [Pseudomonas lactis]